jgi:hypothetical protein
MRVRPCTSHIQTPHHVPFPPTLYSPHTARAPCPMLNTLANHNFLPHNGKAITSARVKYALGTALNIDAGLSQFLFDFALTTSPEANATTFSLNDLGRHNILEHDASLRCVKLSNLHSSSFFLYHVSASPLTFPLSLNLPILTASIPRKVCVVLHET